MVAEVITLRHHLALRGGSRDRLASGVAGGILADERRHVPFHRDRLRDSFRKPPVTLRHSQCFRAVSTLKGRLSGSIEAPHIATNERIAVNQGRPGRWREPSRDIRRR
ncbi:hypothetical protein Aros01_01275 [Streptosporangium roseum]|uniref:Uncharacterized protein n=1 Tax=Streptosporangium roseum (strain ATCC 12428 / DSM 43021 / JCM 3005 / KCTC 9067 / NCIMB 10171 / NRRL 2505 / NI 9100) TaxID=479432 RepID=D2AQL7_STRRD|nr:hypothetical protein Sros_1568 [Streptosporangium roseum DSM 43021]